MESLRKRRAIVKENAIKFGGLFRTIGGILQTCPCRRSMQANSYVPSRHCDNAKGEVCGRSRIELGKTMAEAAQKMHRQLRRQSALATRKKVVPGSGLELMSALASASRRQTGDLIDRGLLDRVPLGVDLIRRLTRGRGW